MPRQKKNVSPAGLAEMAEERCLAMRVRRLSRLVTRRYDDVLRPHGLTAAQLNLLAVVTGAGGITAVELGRILDIEKSTLSRNLRLLHSQGLLKGVAGNTPAGQVIELSVKGEVLFSKAMQSWLEIQKRLERVLKPDDVAVLDRLAKAIRQA